MTSYYYSLLVLFCIAAYLISSDQNVARAVVLVLKLIKSKCSTAYLHLWLHPKNPIFKYISWRRSWKLAEELQREFGVSSNDKLPNDD